MVAITTRVIAVGVKYNMASQFRFGCILVTIIKVAICRAKLSCRIPYGQNSYAIVAGNVGVTFIKFAQDGTGRMLKHPHLILTLIRRLLTN